MAKCANHACRYEIATSDKATWEGAEKQVRSAAVNGTSGKAATVTVPKPTRVEEETVKEKGKKGKDGSEKKRKVSAMEDARKELEKVENSQGGKKKKKSR